MTNDLIEIKLFSCSDALYSRQWQQTIVVTQFYMTEAENEYVIKGNSAIMKCKIPSFVADFVHIEAWINAEDGTELTHNSSQSYG